jgi:Bacterial regulatory proteins, gntR family
MYTHLFTKPAYLSDAPHKWRAGLLDRDALEMQAQQMMNGTDFEKQRQHFAQYMLQTYTSNWALDRVMRNHARFALLSFLMYLHHQKEQTGGITYSGLLDLFQAGQHTSAGVLASPSRIKAMLMLSRMAGHLRLSAQSLGADRRTKTLEPTDKLLIPAQQWLAGFLQSMQSSLPMAASAEKLNATPGLLGEVLSYNVQAYVHDHFTLHESFQGVQRFMQRDGGYLLLMALMQTMERDPASGQWHASAQPHALSQEFRISRGTVRNALADCVAEGWIVSQARGGRDWLLSDTFAYQCRRWAAYEMVWMAGNVNAAYVRLTST